MKVILVCGARPNFMKIAPIWREMRRFPETFKPVVVHTGQHYDYEMSQVFFEDLQMARPDIYLGVGSGTHAQQTAKVLTGFEEVLLREKPDLVLVVGDVNSTLAAALASVKLHVPVAHVEAGLRSFDRRMPEEINRILTDAISDYLFTPSPDGDENLKKEGVPTERIHLVGNVMVDSLLSCRAKAEQSGILSQLGLEGQDYAVLTLHRPENVDDAGNLKKILAAVGEVCKLAPVAFPAHPRTRRNMEEAGLGAMLDDKRLIMVKPLGYLDFVKLEMASRLVMTDSGGIQEETTVLGVPCLTLRKSTERPITVTEGTNTIVGDDPAVIVREAAGILGGRARKGGLPALWDGKAAARIVDVLRQ